MKTPILPDRPSFLEQCKQSNLIPVYTEVFCDMETPVSAYLKLAGEGDRFLLESVEQGQRFSRYSFVGFQPTITFSAKNDQISIVENGKLTEYKTKSDPLTELQQLMSRYRPVTTSADLPLFYGGAVGYLAYEMVRYFEPTVPLAALDDLKIPDAYFVIADKLLIFDHFAKSLKIVVNAWVEGNAETAYETACEKIHALLSKLETPVSYPPLFTGLKTPEIKPEVNMTQEYYLSMAKKMSDYIKAGDIFQVVPSQRFQTPYGGTAIDLYRAMRFVNPSPYMFCLEFGKLAIVGASPEMQVRSEDGQVAIRPIAGTRPRCERIEEDLAMEQELLADEKERAEHIMLVDLARNDVGRVCHFNTVKVSELMTVERYSHVMHIVSHVEGHLNKGKNVFDVIRATFPAGTVSGSPKVRAMQIIAELEPTYRGTYAGVVGYFSFSGNLDSCIAIRTVLLKEGMAYLQAGGGLVADSTPEGEYQESVNKAKAGMKALALAKAHASSM